MIVLLVEDDADLRGMLGVVLPPEFEVRGCSTGTEGLRALHCERVDVLLTDLDLPGVSGEELARVARTLPRPVAVVIMSGNLARLEASRSLADAVVVKPSPLAAVRAALTRVSQRRGPVGSGALSGATLALALVASLACDVSPPTAASKASLELRADCNVCGGSYVAGPDTLAVGDALACTVAACSTSPFDTDYVTLVAGATRWSVQGAELELRSAAGRVRFHR